MATSAQTPGMQVGHGRATGNTLSFPATLASSDTATENNQPSSKANAQDLYTTSRLQLSGLLQTSLEINRILQLFFEAMEEQLAVSSLHYLRQGSDQGIERGNAKKHSCHYRLNINDEPLGELRLTRGKRFSERELQTLELFIGTLVCPIRNALLYDKALQTALLDPLTDTGNRIALDATLTREIALAQRHQRPLTILVIDIDFFKDVNDRYGHSAGDCVLKKVAAELKDCCRGTDTCFRYGGEEFVVILDKANQQGARLAAERLRQRIESMQSHYEQQLIEVTASIGLATLRSGDDMDKLFNRADKALYNAKENGRNQVVEAVQKRPQAEAC